MYVVVAIVAGAVLIGVIVYLLRDRLTDLNFDFLKGVVRFGSKASAASPVISSTDSTPDKDVAFERQYMSHAVLHVLQAKLKKTQGHHAILDTTTENFHAATTIYSQLHGDIIGTCFFENADYGDHDLAKAILSGSNFTRITVRSMCDEATQETVARRFQTYRSKSLLIVLDEETEVSKIGGIFCKCDDGSHLAFMAMNNFCDAKPKNLGLVYCGDLAEQMYSYYKSFVERYA